MLHVICTRLRPGHLSVRVGDRRLQKISNSAFECDYYNNYYFTATVTVRANMAERQRQQRTTEGTKAKEGTDMKQQPRVDLLRF